MNNTKRKCNKGCQHSGRAIEAVCLESQCQQDRLLCFYCIHQSHAQHSIAYLIPGLKSPLELLNKNSQVENPQIHMKYIEKRFKKINNAWLRISDNLQNGISKIEQKMIPQFNVIRETFKKNSVQQIIRELTSNQITPSKIQQYVNMINMIKRYKFNDIKKLKIMSYIIQHKLSKVFLNANNKIKNIMQTVIGQTDQMNFINFNLQKVMKDRELYLKITNKLNFYKIQQLNINNKNIIQTTINNNNGNQFFQQQQNYILIENNHNYNEQEMFEQKKISNQNQIIEERQEGDQKVIQNDIKNIKCLQVNQKLQTFNNVQVQFQSNKFQQQSQEIISTPQKQIIQIQPQQQQQQSQSDIDSDSSQYSNGFRSLNQRIEKQININLQNKQQNIIQQFQQKIQKRKISDQIQFQLRQIKQIDQLEKKELQNSFSFYQMKRIEQYNYYDHSLQSYSQMRKQYQKQNVNALQEINLINQEKQSDKQLDQTKFKYLLSEKNQNNNLQDKQISHQNEANEELNEFSCQFPSINASQGQVNQNYSIQSDQQYIQPSYCFDIKIRNNQLYDKNAQKQIYNDQEITNQTWRIQKMNQNNKFQQCFGSTDDQVQQKKRKQFQLLKKYFIFAKSSDQEQSSQQQSIELINEKRKQYLLKRINNQNKGILSQQSNIRKKVKKNIDNHQQNKYNQNIIQLIDSQKNNMNQSQESHQQSLQANKQFINSDENLQNNEQKQKQYRQLLWNKQSLVVQIQSNLSQSKSSIQREKQKQNLNYLQNINKLANNRALQQKKHQNNSTKLNNYILAQVSNQFIKKCQYKMKTERNQKLSSINQKRILAKVVHLSGWFHQQICKKLSLIDQHSVQQLTIYCDTIQYALNQQSVNVICKMKKLKSLRVYWAYRLSKILVRKLINNLSQLTQLVLCQYHDVDTQLANQIVLKLPNLQRFHYASDYLKNLDKMQENLQFFIDVTGSQSRLAPLFNLSQLKDLQTLWISDIDNLKQTREIIQSMKNIKQVSVHSNQKTNKNYNIILSLLSHRNSLICLSLQSLFFWEEHLVSVIKNNPNLNTIYINECPSVSQITIREIANNCPNLEQLYLMLEDNINGQRIFQLTKLKTLVIRACWLIDATKMKQGLKKLQNLTCLGLNMNNYWFTDELLPSIAALQNLVILNIDCTKVTDKGLQTLSRLRNLKTLICGRTQLTANGLFQFLRNTKSRIHKLGLSRESNEQLKRPGKINEHDVIFTQFYGKYLVKIGQLLPYLTHLSIGGFKDVHIQNFATLDNLKCLQYKINGLSEETQRFLQTTNLNMNANL